ncbi:MAG: hypothetical protein LBG65_06905, partial [Puniceicoccales bacterium]|nr:hypothetical protein [Puniceicoccales bacterium]
MSSLTSSAPVSGAFFGLLVASVSSFAPTALHGVIDLGYQDYLGLSHDEITRVQGESTGVIAGDPLPQLKDINFTSTDPGMWCGFGLFIEENENVVFASPSDTLRVQPSKFGYISIWQNSSLEIKNRTSSSSAYPIVGGAVSIGGGGGG